MSTKKPQRPRRSYSEQFKAEVVESVRSGTHTISEVCRNLELTRSAVRAWIARADADGVPAPSRPAETEREELARLRAEVRQLKMERDILKKATAFFAKEST